MNLGSGLILRTVIQYTLKSFKILKVTLEKAELILSYFIDCFIFI
jgi:hypothetical protein